MAAAAAGVNLLGGTYHHDRTLVQSPFFSHRARAGEAQRSGAGVGDWHQGEEAAGGVVAEGGRAGAVAQLEHPVRALQVTGGSSLNR